MPKPNDLSLLFSEHAPSCSPNYFLFLLGTDTRYSHRPTKALSGIQQKYYEQGETFSYLAQLIAQLLHEGEPEITPDSPLSFSAPSVDVINGPTLIGSEIGDRIARGTFLVLKAIAEGKTNIQLTAHSRGAVEAILITHELSRIQKELIEYPEQTLYTCCLRTPCLYTRKAWETLFKKQPTLLTKTVENKELKDTNVTIISQSPPQPIPEVEKELEGTHLNTLDDATPEIINPVSSEETKQPSSETSTLRAVLAQKIAAATVNLFLIDPVPGGRYRGLPGTGWRDSRFYEKVPCNKIEIIVLRDERSRCFIPIVPEGIQPLPLPGHHGTATGNLYDQQYNPSPQLTLKDTALIQQLVVSKILHFINTHTTALKGLPAHNSTIDLAHPELDKVANHYLHATSEEQAQQILALYAEIHKKNNAYKYFTKTNYPYLSTEQSPSGQRYVHFAHHNYTSMEDIVPSLDDEYVNTDHAKLYLQIAIGFFFNEEDNLLSTVSNLTNALNHLLLGYQQNTAKNQALLKSNANRKSTFQAINLFVHAVSQRFLCSHLSLNEKQAILSLIKATLESIDDFRAIDNPSALINQIVIEYKDLIFLAVKTTVEAHYNALLNQSNQLNQQLKYYRAYLQDFETSFTEFLAVLRQQAQGKEEATSSLISQCANQLESVKPRAPATIKAAFTHYLQSIETHLQEENQQIALKSLMKCAYQYQPYLDEEALDGDGLLMKLHQLYEEMQHLLSSHQVVQPLVGPLKLNIYEDDLRLHQDRIIKLAATIFVTNHMTLDRKPDGFSEHFFTKLIPQVIVLGAKVTPSHTLEKQIYEQQALIQQLISPSEIGYAHLIEFKLLPLATQCLKQLQQETNQSSSSIEQDNVHQLLALLQNKTAYPLPSYRMQMFGKQLQQYILELKEPHSSWQDFIQNALPLIGRPSPYLAKASPLFFAKSASPRNEASHVLDDSPFIEQTSRENNALNLANQ